MTLRTTSRSLFIAGLAAALITVGAPGAQAAELTLTDPAGDNEQTGLDIIGSTIVNGDYAVSVTISFRRARSGFYAASLKARERGLLRVAGEYRPHTGVTREFLLDADGRLRCEGLTSDWDATSASVTFQVPSTCLWQGNYGAIRVPWLLTESIADHGDVDVAGPSGWIPRG